MLLNDLDSVAAICGASSSTVEHLTASCSREKGQEKDGASTGGFSLLLGVWRKPFIYPHSS